MSVKDNLIISTADMRDYLRADPTDDPIIEMLIEAAKEKADSYTGGYFDDSDLDYTIEIPKDVEIWVYQTVARFYNRRASGINTENESGFGSISWDKADMEILQEYRQLSW